MNFGADAALIAGLPLQEMCRTTRVSLCVFEERGSLIRSVEGRKQRRLVGGFDARNSSVPDDASRPTHRLLEVGRRLTNTSPCLFLSLSSFPS